jgi:gliding motility-associated-like protein
MNKINLGIIFKGIFATLCSLVIFSANCFAQNETKQWRFGQNAGLDFNFSPPIPVVGSNMNQLEGCSTISDAAGNLLFYTNGITVWNQTNAIMTGGTGLLGNNSTSQSALIVKQPGSGTIYFIFTLDWSGGLNGLNYSTVDMSLSGGMGAVTILNTPLYSPSDEKMTAVKHCNGVDVWVITKEDATNNYRAYLVSASGVSSTPIISVGVGIPSTSMTIGCMKASPSGRKIGCAYMLNATLNDVEVLDFDPSTGFVSNSLNLSSPSSILFPLPYGYEFSPDGTKFYATDVGVIYQWDLCAGSNSAIIASRYAIYTTKNSSGLQMASDGKIYCSETSYSTIGVINSPNSLGAACNYSGSAISIAPAICQSGLPNFVTSYFYAPSIAAPSLIIASYGSACNTVSFTTITPTVCANTDYPALGYNWSFGDPASGLANSSNVTDPTHVFSAAGNYTVKLIVNYACRADTLIQTVTTSGITGVISTTNVTGCYGFSNGSASIAIPSGFSPSNSYTWTNGTNTQTTAIANNLSAGTYSVFVSNPSFSCALSQTLQITQPPALTVNIASLAASVCVGSAINFTASALGGSPAYSYTWAGPSFNSLVQNPSISNVALPQAGNYTLTASDALGCTNMASVSVGVVSVPVLNTALSGNGTLCAQALNGSPNTITLTSFGAVVYTITTPAHIYNANPSGSVSPLQSIPPFLNTIIVSTATIQGSNGLCTSSTTANFTIVPNPTVSIGSSTPVICAGQSFTYTSSGAQSYTWGPETPGLTTYNSPVTIANPTVTSVYSVVGGSLFCNSATETTTLTVNPLPLISVGSTTICSGVSTALIASGTASNFTWSPSSGLSSNTGFSVSANPIGNQLYTVVGELNSCTMSAQASVIVLPPPIVNSSVSQATICLNESTNFKGSGVGSSGKYLWSGPNGNVYSGADITVKATNMNYSGIYTLTVMNEIGCKNSTMANLIVNALPNGNLSGSKEGCLPFCTMLTFNANSPSTTASWQYNQQPLPSPSFTNCFITSGNHILTGYLYDAITTCSNTVTTNITVHDKPQADFEYSPNKAIEGFDGVNFNSTSKGENLSAYNWYFNTNIVTYNNTGYQANTKNTNYLFDKAGIYSIALLVKNAWGCTDTITKSITIEPDFNLYVPNSFTPNEDSTNEIFQAKGTGIKTFKLFVINRWGENIFESNDITKGWDGTYKGQPCKSDVYAWKLRATDVNGKAKDLSGHVTLHR